MSDRSAAERIARWRVPLGFACGAAALWLAEPTVRSLTYGAALATVGETLRLWAAGHVDKSREVTRSGPYRFIAHPLYVGSSIIGAGIAIAAHSVVVAVIVMLYLVTMVTTAIRAEEAHLREKFGAEYDAYKTRSAPPTSRSFSAARAVANREHRAIAGLLAGLVLLALKVRLSVP